MKNRIRELRTERGWSQAELAQRLGVSRQSVNAFETGRSDPSLLTAFRITESLGSGGRAQLEQDDWTYCGSWMGSLHHFKRQGRVELGRGHRW